MFGTSKLLNINDATKRIGNFFKLPIQLFHGVPYPELAFLIFAPFVLGALHVSFCGLYIFCIIRCWEYGLLVFCDGFYVSYFGVVEYDDI